MTRYWLTLALACLWAAIDSPAAYAGSATCTGRLINPITDICWSCILPISIGSTPILNLGGQEDIENPPNPLCICPGFPPKIGLTLGFWEPARQVEVTRSPFCLVSLGGISLDPGIGAPGAAQSTRTSGHANASFYQAHYYINPLVFWLEAILGFPCMEKTAFDIAYLTELDPLWNDDELTAILTPEAVLFANPAAIAACATDCVAAAVGFGLKELFWCAGCQGGVYPLDGHVAAHIGGVQSSVLLAQRLTAKLHRELLAWGYHGTEALCGPYLEPIMDKRAYKTQLTYPVPNTSSIDGKCCQPFGRTTVVWGSGKEFPVKGEDFAYILFRKRNCCVGAW
jgi:conjugal transfer pilus assembly protein TraU